MDFGATTPFVLIGDPRGLIYLKPLLPNIPRNNSLPIDCVESRGHVMIVIAKPDHRLGKIVLITERARLAVVKRKCLPARDPVRPTLAANASR